MNTRYFYGECFAYKYGMFRDTLGYEKEIKHSAVVEAQNPIEGLERLNERFDHYQGATVVNFKEIVKP